jgi:hypothetical protein
MSGQTPSPPRSWCVLAKNAPIAAVFVRVYGTPFTHIMKWHVNTGVLESGAWTTLSLKPQRCHVSADGEFLEYLASGGLQSPFPADYGGGSTVSRLPWLTALTKIDAWMKGVFDSATELSAPEQQRLRDLFKEEKPYFNAEDWPEPLGPRWQRVEATCIADGVVHVPRSRSGLRLVGELSVPSSTATLVAVLDRKEASNDRQDEPRFFLRHANATRPYGSHALFALPDSWWANTSPRGLVLLATKAGRLLALRVGSLDAESDPWEIVQDHKLNALVPKPGPSPEWARAPLS